MNDFLNGIPESLRPQVNRYWSDFQIKRPEFAKDHPDVMQSLGKVWAVSPFVARLCVKNPEFLDELIEDGRLFASSGLEEDKTLLFSQLRPVESEAELMRVLRRFRNREMVRIAWRDIAGFAELEETLADLTALAEVCIRECLDYLFLQACSLRGQPLNPDGELQRLVVLGMGKLGAYELNFSSDIDLIFCYETDGTLPGKKELSYSEFYVRLARSLVKALDEVTEDGFVFRVDVRLRPFGDSGPLVVSFDAMELYYQAQAREWERYAMVKARVVAGDPTSAKQMHDLLRPFVYRRYLDYRAFGELRELKQKITLELQRKDRLDNVKLGPGGIREIEFIGQAFQLIRGGQEKSLQQRGILRVLDTLGQLQLLPLDIVSQLKEAYCFLRLVENRIQQYEDKQTHDLPIEEHPRACIAYALGFEDWESFLNRLNQVRAGVHAVFEQLIGVTQTDASLNWLALENERLGSLLAEMGFEPQLFKVFESFRMSAAISRLTQRGEAELNRLLPMLLNALQTIGNPTETLQRIFKLLETVAGRNVYFTLLVENPQALNQLVKLASESAWLIHYIAKFPLLLDELLDTRTLYSPLSREQLQIELKHKLDSIDKSDLEQLMTVFRQFKQANVLRIAAADIMNIIPVMVVSDYLTWLAEAIISEALALAWRLTAEKHGAPPGGRIDEIKGFGVIAYGKMGGIELSYASDLDLVFLYGGVKDSDMTTGARPISCAQFYAKIAKQIINLFTANMLSGTLYEIDLRLRPSGNSGLLVSSLEAYEAYQFNSAWTWEQQALVRARFIAGDDLIKESFSDIRRRSLARNRDIAALKKDVREMREKMRENLSFKETALFDLKQGTGGIADIEFIVQFKVLSVAKPDDGWLRWTDVVRLLDSLQIAGDLKPEDASCLKQAYCLYREQTHKAALLEKPALVPMTEYSEMRSRVEAIWHEVMER